MKPILDCVDFLRRTLKGSFDFSEIDYEPPQGCCKFYPEALIDAQDENIDRASSEGLYDEAGGIQ